MKEVHRFYIKAVNKFDDAFQWVSFGLLYNSIYLNRFNVKDQLANTCKDVDFLTVNMILY
jgi:hypothetical protein